jgi:hypothetical protein
MADPMELDQGAAGDAAPAIANDPVHDSLDAALSEFDAANGRPSSEASTDPDAPDPDAAPEYESADAFRAAWEEAGLSESEIERLLPPDLRDLEMFSKAKDGLLENYQFGRAVLDQYAASLRAEREALRLERDRQDANRAISTLISEIPEVRDLPRSTVENLVIGIFERSAPLQKAWENRAHNPQAWSRAFGKVRDGLARDFARRYDPEMSETVSAVAAAVTRYASARPAEEKAPDLSRMDQAAFENYTKRNFGF